MTSRLMTLTPTRNTECGHREIITPKGPFQDHSYISENHVKTIPFIFILPHFFKFKRLDSIKVSDFNLRSYSKFNIQPFLSVNECFLTVARIVILIYIIYTGVNKSLVLDPGTSWISGRTSIYFYPMSGGQVRNSAHVYFSLNIRYPTIHFGQVILQQDELKYFVLARGTSDYFKIF